MYDEKYRDSLEYIDKYWSKIIFKPSKMQLRYGLNNIPILFTNLNSKFLLQKKIGRKFIEIPHQYFVPNDQKFKYIFYWDSFFMFKGLMGTRREYLMKEMVENFIYLFNHLQIIPNFSAPAALGRSQPPFLSSMVLDAYLTPLNKFNNYKSLKGIQAVIYKLRNKKWLEKAINTAKREYEKVWIDNESLYNHSVEGYSLSRYGDRDIGYSQSSELESGWDMTSRFYNRCNEFLPIDLNSYLYKYEMDFAYVGTILGNQHDHEYWLNKANMRKKEIVKLMWNEQEGFFYDYGYRFKRQSKFMSLAGFTPLWTGMATAEQARKMVNKLPKFESKYGLMITAKESLAESIDLSQIQSRYHPSIEEIIKPKQWDFPNIWSPLEYLTVIGLLRYGYIAEAKRIMKNSVEANSNLYKKHKTFFEKINGETGEAGSGALYGDQRGFGWTNSIFHRYVHILDQLDTLASIYIEPKPAIPPFHIAILH